MTDQNGGTIPPRFRNLPGIWQLREGPRLIGLWILWALLLCAFSFFTSLDRVVLTFSEPAIDRVEALLACLLVPPLILYLGRKKPPQPKYGKTQWQLIQERFLKSPQAQVGFFFVFTILLVAMLAAYLAPFGPDEIRDAVTLKLRPPLTDGYLLGSDHFSRDVLSRMIYGARISLLIGFLSISLSATLGLVFGLLAGYFGGFIDTAIMRVVDVLLSLPRLVFLLVLVILFKDLEVFSGQNRVLLIAMFLAAMGWMGTARLVRGEVLSRKEMDFVQAGRALGFSNWRLLFRHIAPNCLSPVIVSATLGIGGTILVDASLSFLGLGVPPPTATWGKDVSDAQAYITSGEWWMSVFPGLAIMLAVTAFNLLGDGLRDAIDPRLASTGKLPSKEELARLAEAS